jgi:hypothetical protein
VEPALLRHPDVLYFCRRNPDHARGDELCCIGRIDVLLWLSYMAKLGRRLLSRIGPPWAG